MEQIQGANHAGVGAVIGALMNPFTAPTEAPGMAAG